MTGKVGGKIIFFITQVLLVRNLSPQEFGVYALTWELLLIISTLTPLGIDKGVIKFGVKYWKTDKSKFRSTIFQSLLFTAFSGFIMCVIFYLAAPWISSEIFNEPSMAIQIKTISPAFIFYPLLVVSGAVTRISKRLQFSVISEDLSQPIIFLTLYLAFNFLGYGLIGAPLAAVISIGISFGVALYFLFRLYKDHFLSDKKAPWMLSEIFKYSLPITFSAITNRFLGRIDRLILGILRTASLVAIFQVVSQTAVVYAIILGSFAAIFSPLIPYHFEKGNIKQLDDLYKITTKWSLYFSLPIFLVILFVSGDLLTLVFGPSYAIGANVLIVLSISQLLNAGSGSVGPILNFTGFQKSWFGISFSSLIINVVLNLILISYFDLLGVAYALLITNIFRFTLGIAKIKRAIGIFPYDSRFIKGLVAAVGTGIILNFIYAQDFGSPLILIVTLSISSLILFALFLFVMGFDPEDKEIISLVIKRVK